jgi:hypothetical protein
MKIIDHLKKANIGREIKMTIKHCPQREIPYNTFRFQFEPEEGYQYSTDYVKIVDISSDRFDLILTFEYKGQIKKHYEPLYTVHLDDIEVDENWKIQSHNRMDWDYQKFPIVWIDKL